MLKELKRLVAEGLVIRRAIRRQAARAGHANDFTLQQRQKQKLISIGDALREVIGGEHVLALRPIDQRATGREEKSMRCVCFHKFNFFK